MTEAPLVDPVEGILAVLDRGQATGTSKFGLLLALIELAPLTGPDRRVALADIAEQILRIHWDHIAPFPAPELGGALVLSQVTSSNRESIAITEVQRLRGQLPANAQHLVLDRVRGLIPDVEWHRSVRRVRAKTRQNPVQHLQRIDGVSVPFLFALDPVADALLLTPAAADDLVRFGPVLKELVQARFVRLVLAANRALAPSNIESRIGEHLFGSARQMPGEPVRRDLALLQRGACVYTGATLPGRGAPVDHVVPWSRVRLSTLGNFVLTTASVNSAKSDLMLAYDPLARWADHLDRHAAALREIAQRHSWPADAEATRAVAARVYLALRPGSVLWSPDGAHPASAAELAAIGQLLGAA